MVMFSRACASVTVCLTNVNHTVYWQHRGRQSVDFPTSSRPAPTQEKNTQILKLSFSLAFRIR
jgi:hypothetical protein